MITPGQYWVIVNSRHAVGSSNASNMEHQLSHPAEPAHSACGVRAAVQHVSDKPRGQSARPCLAAQPRGYRDVCERSHSGSEPAVERHMGEKRLGQLQYLVSPPQLLDLALQVLDPLGLADGDAFAHAGINLRALDLFVQGLRHKGDYGSDVLDGAHNDGYSSRCSWILLTTRSRLNPFRALSPFKSQGDSGGNTSLMLHHHLPANGQH